MQSAIYKRFTLNLIFQNKIIETAR